MTESYFGQLTPVGGGDPIPLRKKELLIGRAETSDIVLRFANVSSRHCLLSLKDGYWFVTDLDSRNGVKVNDHKVLRKRIDPNDKLSVAKNDYVLDYSPLDCGAVGPPPKEDEADSLLNASLLQRANLQKRTAYEEARRSGKPGGKPGSGPGSAPPRKP